MARNSAEIDFCDESIYASGLLTSKNFPPLKNDRVLKAARGERPDKLPIWIMRQAGRYLPEFIELRKHFNFFRICQEPYLACNVTLMPIRRFDLDAAIIFSDILVIPQALGMEVIMGPQGPYFPNPLTVNSLHCLQHMGVIARLSYVGRAITLTRHLLKGRVPLFGFSGAPWTLMSYMIEGNSTKAMSKAKKWLYAHKKEAHQLIQMLTEVITDYLVMQVEAGAQILQVFDTSAEYLNLEMYNIYGLPYLKTIRTKIREKLHYLELEDVPVVLFAKGASYCLEEQTELGYDVIALDWMTNVERCNIRKYSNVTFQGNLDPCALYASKEELEQHILHMVKKFDHSRYIVNLGHGIYPDMDIDAVQTFVDTIHNVKMDE